MREPTQASSQSLPDGDRLPVIDVLRGLALLGILIVNIQFFGLPLGDAIAHMLPPGSAPQDTLAFYTTKVFFEGKYYTIFSTLFGAGLTIQWLRAKAAGRPWGPMIARRLCFLAALGLAHGILLWYGDILLTYALMGAATLFFLRCSPRTLTILAACIIATATLLLATATALLEAPHEPVSAAVGGAASDPLPVASPMETMFAGWKQHQGQDPASSIWRESEVRAMRDGPYLQALFFRAISWVTMIIVTVLGFGWSVLAMMLSGVAMVKTGFFLPENTARQKRYALRGLALGLPLAVAAALAPTMLPHRAGTFVGSLLAGLSHPVFALGSIGLVCSLVHAGVFPRLAKLLSGVGRTALTSYLLETLICITIFYHFGFRRFATLGRAELLLVALAVYAGVACIALMLRSTLRHGPMEWLWRSVTYARVQPILRDRTRA